MTTISNPFLRIERQPAWRWIPGRELWEFRELLYFIVSRDLKVRYKQTILGVSWAIIQPLLSMLIFTVFFGRLVKVPSDGVPYPIFAYAGLLPWMYFSNALAQSSNSLVGSVTLLTKVYFPRLILPLGTVLSSLADLCAGFLVLVALMAYYGFVPQARILLAPLFVLLAVISSLGVGLWLSALNVKYRDVRYIVPFLLQFWMFATPVIYPSSLLSPRWRVLYGINPMTGVIEGFRWSLLNTSTAPGPVIAVSSAVALLTFCTGVLYFRRQERIFADVI